MALAETLYEASRFAVVGSGPDRVRVCVAEVDALVPAPSLSSATFRRVLLIHGNPSHLGHWEHTASALRTRAAVLAYDQPGLGRSDDFADAKHTLERSADTARAVLDYAGWTEPVDVIGQSHGGLVALALGALAPERVRSIALLSTGGTPSHPMYRLFRLPGLDNLLFALGKALSSMTRPPASAKGWLERTMAAAIRAGARSGFRPDPVPASVIADGLNAPPTILRTMVRLAHDGPCEKVAAYARQVRSPVLFLHAREDSLVHISYARRLYDLLRGSGCLARFVELEGGHMVHFTRPDTINPILTGWLSSSVR